MKGLIITVCTVFAIFGLSWTAFADSGAYQVTFETLECNGESGFATVGVDQIFKIQPAGCAGGDGKPLKQMLVHDYVGSYNIFTLTEEESANINKEIKAYMDARRGILERSEAIIVRP